MRARLVCCPQRKLSQPTRTLTFPMRTLVLKKGRLTIYVLSLPLCIIVI
ncbi:hypothetical protein Hanom_Chr09g00828101 [Helianthus anomalus]